MNRNQLLSLLKINGYDTSASDEDIRAVLLSSNYSESEVKAALNIVRENDAGLVPRVDGLHTVFYSDRNLRPSEISGLLGVDVEMQAPISARSRKNTFSLLQFILIWFFSVVLAVSAILFYMYLNQVGLFHPVTTVQL